MEKAHSWKLLLDTTYGPEEAQQIDDLQLDWSRRVSWAVPGIRRELLFEVLLCLREAVLNALSHGCREDQRARVMIRLCEQLNKLRVMVADPGGGHAFDPQTRIDNVLLEGHRGLLLMSELPSAFYSIRKGASVAMDFPVQRKK